MAYRIVAIPTVLSNLQSHALLAGEASEVRYFVQLRSSWQQIFNWQCVARSLCRSWHSCQSIGVHGIFALPCWRAKKSCIGQKRPNIMCKCAKSLSFLETLSPTPDSYRSFAREPHWGTSDPPLPLSPDSIKLHWVPLLQSTVVF